MHISKNAKLYEMRPLTGPLDPQSSPDTVAATLEHRQAELGFGNLVAIQQFGSLPADLTEKNLRLFSGEVMPRIRHLGVTAAEPAPVGE